MKPFIPPKDDDIDYNPEIEMMIERDIELRFTDPELDIRDSYEDESDDLELINIG